MKITFLGAVGEVTGSKYLIEHNETKILVDCGLFQEDGDTKNRYELPVDPKEIQAVVLTHAHIDHTGYIPALVKHGFKGKIYCSSATYALCSILLIDSGNLQEKTSFNGPPLYTAADAEKSLHFFNTVAYDTSITIGSLTCTLIRSGHILGASFVIVSDGKKTLTFSGDLGRPHQLIMKEPPALTKTDYLVLESTYGDRLHKKGDPLQELSDIVRSTMKKGGTLVIPAFSVGRTQAIIYLLYLLKKQRRIPDIPVYLDSPMATKVTDLYGRFADEHKLTKQQCQEIFESITYVQTAQQSKKLDKRSRPTIIVAGSGMATGGRVLEHLQNLITRRKTTVLFVGFQAEGTLGRALIEGAQQVEIYGKPCTVRATIATLETLSAHADYNEILDWLSHFATPPKKTFITHGEPEAAESLQQKIIDRFGWTAVIPTYKQTVSLD